MKRLVWFTFGAAAGVSGSVYARRKAREAAQRYRPVSMAKGAIGRVGEAVREGRAAAAAKEAELREREDAGPLAEPVPLVGVEPAAAEPLEHGRTGPRRRSRR